MLNEFKNININFSQHEGEDVEKINCEYLVYNELSNNNMSVSELDTFIEQYIKKIQYLNDEMRSIFLSENI